jgi:hypothetical protein
MNERECRYHLEYKKEDKMIIYRTRNIKKSIIVAQGRSNNRDIPLAEVRLSSKEIATKIR